MLMFHSHVELPEGVFVAHPFQKTTCLSKMAQKYAEDLPQYRSPVHFGLTDACAIPKGHRSCEIVLPGLTMAEEPDF